jgi:signal transduction histidine kinase
MKTGFFLISLLIIMMLLASGCMQPAVRNATVTPPEPSSRDTMVAFVKEAVLYAHTNGREAALAEFSKKNGSFFRGDLYIYAYDFNGTTIAHPVNPEKIGINRLFEPDAMGHPFIRELRALALNGSGFSEYYYINPVHNNSVEKKLGYVEKVDGDWWLGSGIYVGPLDSPATAPAIGYVSGENAENLTIAVNKTI